MLQDRLSRVWAVVGPLVNAATIVGVAGASVAITLNAIWIGRPIRWWLRTDACPDPTITCGQLPWAGIAVLQAVGVVVVAIWLYGHLTADTFAHGGES
jgi:hypothetical protein